MIEASACCDRLNVANQFIRERVRSSQRIKFIGHLKGRGRRGYKISKPLPSYQPEKKGFEVKNCHKAISIFEQRTVLLHNTQKFDNHFRAWADEYLTFPSFFGVIDGVERIIEDTCFDHFANL